LNGCCCLCAHQQLAAVEALNPNAGKRTQRKRNNLPREGGTASDPIFSLLYFRDVIEEVRDPEVPAGYWSYIMPELENLERKWHAKQILVADADIAPAGRPKSKETR
jgi:hypothetical protein